MVVASGEAATSAVLTGDLDVLPSVSTDEADRLRASSDVVFLLERPLSGRGRSDPGAGDTDGGDPEQRSGVPARRVRVGQLRVRLDRVVTRDQKKRL